MSKRTVKIGTRGSKLAMWQAEFVRSRLAAQYPSLVVEIVPIKTTGDIVQDVALARLEGKAFFTKEIEEALLAARVDIAVHSGKDVPTEQPYGLALAGFLKRHSPLDAWISTTGETLANLPRGATVGTSSLRRRALLASLRPDLRLLDLRGNVDTRLRKLGEGAFDAIVLAAAGLERLGMVARVTELLDPIGFPPAVAQGAIAIEIRQNETEISDLLSAITDNETTLAARAERALLSALEGGCQVPLGALAQKVDGRLELNASLLSLDGRQRIDGRLSGNENAPEALGQKMAHLLLSRGGDALLASIRGK